MEENQVVDNQRADPVADNTDDSKTVVNNDEKVPMPPEIERRFNQIYREKKIEQAKNKEMQDRLAELTKASVLLQKKLEQSERQENVDAIRHNIRVARENGDVETEEKYREMLVELKAEEKANAVVKVTEKEPETKKVETPFDVIPEFEARMINKWVAEKDEDGEPLRPWAVDSDHPKADAAAKFLATLIQNPRYDSLDIEEKLQMVDEKFAEKPKTKRDVNAVASSTLTKQKQIAQDKLSDDEKRVAYRMFSSYSREDAEKMYLDGKKLTGLIK